MLQSVKSANLTKAGLKVPGTKSMNLAKAGLKVSSAEILQRKRIRAESRNALEKWKEKAIAKVENW